MTIDKQPHPNESGPYMVSDHGSNTWGAAFYDHLKMSWRAWSPFSPGDGWGDIPDPDLWMNCGEIAEIKVTEYMSMITLEEVLERLRDYGLPGEFTMQNSHIDWYWCLSHSTEDSKADQEELSENLWFVMDHIEKHTGHCVEIVEIWQDHDSCGFEVILKDYRAKYEAALQELQSTPCPGLFEIKGDRIRWFYIASYVDATRVEDLIKVQDEALQHVIQTRGEGFVLKGIGHEHDRCWFEIRLI